MPSSGGRWILLFEGVELIAMFLSGLLEWATVGPTGFKWCRPQLEMNEAWWETVPQSSISLYMRFPNMVPNTSGKKCPWEMSRTIKIKLLREHLIAEHYFDNISDLYFSSIFQGHFTFPDMNTAAYTLL